MKPKFNESAMTLTYELEGEDGDPRFVELPAEFVVCHRCSGKGKHVHPSMHVMTSSDFAEMDFDEIETFHRGGYDVVCEECKGARVCPMVNEEACNAKQRAELDAVIRAEREHAYYEREAAAERAMGA